MSHMLQLSKLDSLSDPQMVNELKTQLTNSLAPSPSVETILHAALPYTFVDHTHADAVVTITNTSNGEDRIKEIYGESVVIIPYVMPGFDLAKEVVRIFSEQSSENTEGMVLMNHGIFTFGTSAKESYDRMIDLVSKAENYLESQNAWEMVQEGIPVTLISDNMSGHMMSHGEIDAIVVGTDRVAGNGDVANKIGTYMVAVLAKRHNIPFYVACPLSTIDRSIQSGADIPIEERPKSEVTGYQKTQWAAKGISVRNPAFDVTPADLVTGLITEKGVVSQPR